MFTLRLFKIKLHSRRVQVLKRVLPIFAFLFAGVLLVWPTLIEQKDKFSLATKNTDAVNSKINMQGVRFFSLDGKNQPLVVVADSVQETDPNSQIITLEEPKATLKMNNGEVLNSETAYGFAFQKDEYLYFEDEVYSTTDSGWEAYSYRVVVDYKNNIMESDTPVRIIGPAGKLNADGFLLFNNADNINFKGNTKTIIYDTLDDIMVTSEDGLFVIQPDRTITAVKNAVVTQTEKTLTADKIILYYTEDKENRIEKIEAFGHVKAWTPDEEITGERGDYNPKTGLITMTDNVTLTQGVNTMSGDRAFMNMQTGVSTLSEKPNKNPDDIKKRVRGSLIPAQLK